MSGSDVEHDVSVVGVGVEVADVPVAYQVSSAGVGYGEVDYRVVSSGVEECRC